MSEPVKVKERVENELRMSLAEHLTELRKRLMRVTGAVLVLGVISLMYARPLFALLMRPVLEALPESQRSLIYTSGIEEINVLMKVGMYAGIFLATPVILYQIWGFVSPGLYANERRFAAPFVVLGSIAFIIGALFCYFALLPTMFKFLLQNPDAADLQARMESIGRRETEIVRLVRVGDLSRAAELSTKATQELGGAVLNTSLALEVPSRLDALGRLIDATHDVYGEPARPVLRQVMDRRLEALAAVDRGALSDAAKLLDDSAALLAGVAPTRAGELGEVWKMEKSLATARAVYAQAQWTKPMLTMREQLSLVLLLELAFGIIFELPIVMALLATVGLVTSKFLFKYQRHAFVVCLLAAAIITPTGDAVNLALMAGPMILCYEIGVVAVWLIEKRRKKRDAETTALAPPAAP